MVRKRNDSPLGIGFVPRDLLPPGEDEYYLRNRSFQRELYRPLTAREIEVLVKNGNSSDDWNSIRVKESFDPERVEQCSFYGLVRIGTLEEGFLEYHDLRLPIGLKQCTIISCDVGDNCALQNLGYLAYMILEDEVILMNIDEMVSTNHAKFGNGIVKDGEDPAVRIEIELANENGNRSVYPFDGMLAGDAFLWSRFREKREMLQAFGQMTDKQFDSKRGHYGRVGRGSVIKNSRILKDLKIGSGSYIKGANKLKNLTIKSSEEFPTQIGEGVELVNGIVGYGCRIFYGVKAVRFHLADHSNLKYGARLINSFLGENSTISCCEVLNALIFPGHEQHHNNSFLCAASLLGQSNIAAGATIGSNHNSRGPDGEIFAGRGFWPALCTSLKHNSRFASYTLLAKGSYPAELNITLPFSLISNNESRGCLEINPAYWFRYNMYALARNSWKYGARDKRVDPDQTIEFDYLAPDSCQEISHAVALIEVLIGLYLNNINISSDDTSLSSLKEAYEHYIYPLPLHGELPKALKPYQQEGIRYLSDPHSDSIDELPIFGCEKGVRPGLVKHPQEAWTSYRNMIAFYAVKQIINSLRDCQDSPESCIQRLREDSKNIHRDWFNVGGQIVQRDDIELLEADILSGNISSWEDVHQRYRRWSDLYPKNKAAHAIAVMDLHFPDQSIREIIDTAIKQAEQIRHTTRASREKDYASPFRRMVYRSDEEMKAVIGSIDDNSFIEHINKEMEEMIQAAYGLKQSITVTDDIK